MRWLRAFLMLSLTLALLPPHFIAAQTLAGEIVFTSDRDGGFIYEGHVVNMADLYLMNADGSNIRKLTDTSADASPNDEDWNEDRAPAWSPDGTQIAFGRGNEPDNVGDLYLIKPDGSGLANITPSLFDEYSYNDPTWSPNGRQLLSVEGNSIVGVGSCTNYELGDGGHPDWSPNGTRLVFSSGTYPTQEILVMSADGSNRQNLTDGGGDNLDPVWSPDGTKIAFASNRTGSYEIYVMNATGSGVTRLTNNAIEDREPAWSPDSTKIAFTRTFADGNAEIFAMNANGSNQTNLTNHPGNDRHPDWKKSSTTASRTLLVSSNSDGKVGSTSFKDEDILAYNLQSRQWGLYFDGSDVGISKDVDALGVLWDGSMLLSFNAPTKVPGLGLVSDADIVCFVPTQLGATTAGTFVHELTGAEIGLEGANEDIDAIGVDQTTDWLLLSTIGDFTTTDEAPISGQDKDIFAVEDRLYEYETTLYLDGSTVGLTTGKEDIGGIAYEDGKLYLSVLGAFAVPGATGDGADIFTPTSCTQASCLFERYWDGSAAGFGNEVIDAFEFVNLVQLPAAAASVDNDAPYAEGDDEFADDEQGEAETFLPLVQR